MKNYYHLQHLPTNLAPNQLASWLKQNGWTQDANPTGGDVILLDSYKDGAGPEGAVGIIQQASGNHPWRAITIHILDWSGEATFTEATCNNVTNHIFENIYDGYGGGVLYYRPPQSK